MVINVGTITVSAMVTCTTSEQQLPGGMDQETGDTHQKICWTVDETRKWTQNGPHSAIFATVDRDGTSYLIDLTGQSRFGRQ